MTVYSPLFFRHQPCMVKGSCLTSGSSLTSGELSGSRLTRSALGGGAGAFLHSAHLRFRLP